jgi:hypothetical protein
VQNASGLTEQEAMPSMVPTTFGQLQGRDQNQCAAIRSPILSSPPSDKDDHQVTTTRSVSIWAAGEAVDGLSR